MGEGVEGWGVEGSETMSTLKINIQHRTSNLQHRNYELLDLILVETEELIKILVTSIKTAEKNRL